MKRPTPPADPLRAEAIELCRNLEERVQTLRDYATTPGNAWLAKGELQAITSVIAEIDGLLENIKQADSLA